MSHSSFALLRVYYTHAVAAECGCCGEFGRLDTVDLDRRSPLCQGCLPVSIRAAEALRLAGLTPPTSPLIELNP